MEEAHALDAGLSGAHLQHSHAVTRDPVFLPLVPRQHGDVVTAGSQPPGHQRLLTLNASNFAGSSAGHLAVARMRHEADAQLPLGDRCVHLLGDLEGVVNYGSTHCGVVSGTACRTVRPSIPEGGQLSVTQEMTVCTSVPW